MPKRGHKSEEQQEVLKKAREAAAETRRLRNAAADAAAPVANPPPASTTVTGSSSPTVAPSAVAPSDNVTVTVMLEAMALGGNDAQAPVANPPAAAPVVSGTAAAPATGTASSSTDAPSAVAPADVTVSLPVADDDDEPRECPGVSRASVVAGEGGGQIYARDVVSAPPNQIGGCLPSPMRAGM